MSCTGHAFVADLLYCTNECLGGEGSVAERDEGAGGEGGSLYVLRFQILPIQVL